MDWKSVRGRALLRMAWPAGYCARRGVSTLYGYLCWGNGYWCNPIDAGEEGHAKADFFGVVPGDGQEDMVDRGLLLPLPDRGDTATWSCLLLDLAMLEAKVQQRVNGDRVLWSIPGREPESIHLAHWPSDEPGGSPPGTVRWVLTVHDAGGRSFAEWYLPPEVGEDAEHALVLIMANLRSPSPDPHGIVSLLRTDPNGIDPPTATDPDRSDR